MNKTMIGAILALQAAMFVQQAWHPTKEWFQRPRISQKPVGGYVRTSETAIQIGRAIITDAFGKRFAKDLEPLRAKEIDGVWIVYSHFEARSPTGELRTGGVTTVQISRTSGSILSLESER